jgi:hypothetical protein
MRLEIVAPLDPQYIEQIFRAFWTLLQEGEICLPGQARKYLHTVKEKP